MMASIADALSRTSVSRFIGDLSNSVFVLQTIHILAIAALMLSIVPVALRAIGIVGPSLDLRREAQRHRHTLFSALGVLAITGVLLVLSDPNRTILTTAFQVKMVLVVVFAGASLAMFQFDPQDPDRHGRYFRAYSCAALPSIVAIIFLGRWIGYS